MPTSLVSNVIRGQDGTPYANVPVVIELIPGPAFRLTDGSEVLPLVETKTDATGTWSVPLEQSTNIDPSSSYYRAKEMVPRVKGGQRVWYFLSPPISPTKLHDCLTVPSVANSLLRPVVVTSTTHPVNPYIGMQIFESDTGRVLYYYGSTVGWQPDWSQAWGELVGISGVAGDFSTASTSYVLVSALNTANVTAIAGRRYITVFSASVQIASSPNGLFVGIYDQAPAQLIERVVNFGANPITVPVEIYYREGAISGLISRSIRMSVTSGVTGTIQMSAAHPAVFSVRDVGPSAAPVITP